MPSDVNCRVRAPPPPRSTRPATRANGAARLQRHAHHLDPRRCRRHRRRSPRPHGVEGHGGQAATAAMVAVASILRRMAGCAAPVVSTENLVASVALRGSRFRWQPACLRAMAPSGMRLVEGGRENGPAARRWDRPKIWLGSAPQNSDSSEVGSRIRSGAPGSAPSHQTASMAPSLV